VQGLSFLENEPVMAVDFMAELKATLIAVQRAGPRQLGSHSTLEELQAYHQMSLPADRQEEIADHLVLCEDCRLLLLYEVIAGPGSALPASEVAEAWERILPHMKRAPGNEGVALAQRMAAGRLLGQEAQQLMLGIVRALAELHARGLLLHSLSAENVLVDPSGQIRLLDRGVVPVPVSFAAGSGAGAEDVLINLYQTLAPEQVAGEALAPRANLFSLGTLFYEMATGVQPFRDTTSLSTLSRVLSLVPPSPVDLDPATDPDLSELIDHLLEKEPEDRPQSAAEVAQRLVSPASLGGSVGEQIDQTYAEIMARMEESGGEPPEIDEAFSRLRRLQASEAQDFRQRFEASLNLPVDAGEAILARARALRKELEGVTSSNPASPQADDP